MARRRVLLYNQLLALMNKSEYYKDRLSPDNAIKDSAYGQNTEDIGFEDLLSEGTLADSSGKRIPGVKGRGTNGRVDKIGRMLDRGRMLFLYLPNEDMPRALYVENNQLKMSEKTLDNMTADDVPPAYRSYLSSALERARDPKRVERRHRNDANSTARVSNSSAEEAFDNLVKELRSTMHYDTELNSMGVRNGMNSLLKGGVILDSEGRRIHSTEHGNRQELIDAIGKRLYDKQEPLYIYRPDEAYPREVYMSRDGSIHISEKPIDKMTDVVPKVWASPFARVGWKNERVFARDRYEIREKLKGQLAERADKRSRELDKINIDSAKKIFDTKLDSVEDMLAKALEAKENAKSYDNGTLKSYGSGRAIEFDPTSNTYVHYNTAGFTPMERSYARFLIRNGLVGKMDAAKRDEFYKENYDKTDDELTTENRQKNATALEGFNSTFTEHPENVKDDVKEAPKKEAEPEKKTEPAAEQKSSVPQPVPVPAPAAPTNDFQQAMLGMMAQMMATNNLLLKKAFGENIPEETKATLENQQKMLDMLTNQLNPNAKQPENAAEEKKEPVNENPQVVNANVQQPAANANADQPAVNANVQQPVANANVNQPVVNQPVVNVQPANENEEVQKQDGLNARPNIIKQEPVPAAEENKAPEKKSVFRPRKPKAENEFDPKTVIDNPDMALEYNSVTEKFVYFNKKDMSPVEEYRARYIIGHNLSADSPEYQDFLRMLEPYTKPESDVSGLKEINEQRQKENKEYYDELDDNWESPEMEKYVAQEVEVKKAEEVKEAEPEYVKLEPNDSSVSENEIDADDLMYDQDIAFEYNNVTGEFEYFNKAGLSPVQELKQRALIQNNAAVDDPQNKELFDTFDELEKRDQQKAFEAAKDLNAAHQNQARAQYDELAKDGKKPGVKEYVEKKEIFIDGQKLDDYMKKLDEDLKQANAPKEKAPDKNVREISENELDKMINEPGTKKKIDEMKERLDARLKEKTAVKKNSQAPGKIEEVELIIYRMEKAGGKPLSENAKDNVYALYNDAVKAKDNIESKSKTSRENANDPKLAKFDATKDVRSIVRFECLKKLFNSNDPRRADLVSVFASRNYRQHIDRHFTGNKLNYICRGAQTPDFYEKNVLNDAKLSDICGECCIKAIMDVNSANSLYGKKGFATEIHMIDKTQFLQQHKQLADNKQREQQAAVNI